MDVADIMTRSVVVLTGADTIGRALTLLEDSGVRHLPVVEGQRVIGMLSDRDVREYRLPIVDELENPTLAEELLARPVTEAMNRDFVFVDDTEPLRRAAELMIEYGVGAVPVLAAKGHELVGMVSYVDLLRIVLEDL